MTNERFRQRTGIQLAYPLEEKRLLRWNQWPVLVQPKLDGERCRAIQVNGRVLLLSSTEDLITSVPHINEWLERNWPRDMPPELELDGELYRHGWHFETIHSVVSRRVNRHEESAQIQYYGFDFITPGSNAEREINRKQWATSTPELFQPDSPVRHTPTDLAYDLTELYHKYQTYLDQGFEGIIIRHPMSLYERKRSTFMMKFKPRKRDSYRIVGRVQEVDKYGNPKPSLGALWLETDGEQFKVGSGFTADQRAEFWQLGDEILDQYCTIDYQSLTPGRNVPKFNVFVSITKTKQD